MEKVRSFLKHVVRVVRWIIYGPKIERLRAEIASVMISTTDLLRSCDSRIRSAVIESRENGLMAEYRKLAADYLRIEMNIQTISIQLKYNAAMITMCERVLSEVKACHDKFRFIDIRIQFLEGDNTELNSVNWEVLEEQMKS